MVSDVAVFLIPKTDQYYNYTHYNMLGKLRAVRHSNFYSFIVYRQLSQSYVELSRGGDSGTLLRFHILCLDMVHRKVGS